MGGRVWWIIHKDLVAELRGRRVWPTMLVLGAAVALMLTVQLDGSSAEKARLVAGQLWLAVFFAATWVLDRSFAQEREDGCWQGLLLYPISPGAVYVAKLAVNLVALGALELLLFPLFAALADVPLFDRPGPLLLVAVLASVGLASVGTLLGAATAALRRAGGITALLVLPAAAPVLLAATEATRLVIENDPGATWWRWVQLMAAFAVMFVTAGTMLFGFVTEE